MAIPNINDSYPVAPLENLFNVIGDGAEADIASAITGLPTARGSRTIYQTNDITSLTAISNAVQGDLAWMTVPGTGIERLLWAAFGGAAGAGIDWRPVTEVRASTLANLTAFIAAVVADADLTFVPGAKAIVGVGSAMATYTFTSTAGAYKPDVFAEASGIAATTSTAGGGASAPFNWSNSYPIVFPVGRFTLPPVVYGAPSDNSSGSILPGAQFTDITTAGCNFRVYRIGATPDVGTKVAWRAVQATATSAAG